MKTRFTALKKHPSAYKQDVAAKFAAKETAWKEQIHTLRKEQKDIPKDSKRLNTQLRLQDKDLAKTSNLLNC